MKKYTMVGRTDKNADTNNHCIGINQLIGSKRDFNFKFEDGTNVVIPYNVIIKYTQTHPECWKCGCWITDEYDEKRWVPAEYILIPDEFILQYK